MGVAYSKCGLTSAAYVVLRVLRPAPQLVPHRLFRIFSLFCALLPQFLMCSPNRNSGSSFTPKYFGLDVCVRGTPFSVMEGLNWFLCFRSVENIVNNDF